jgi:hypothetical protein
MTTEFWNSAMFSNQWSIISSAISPLFAGHTLPQSWHVFHLWLIVASAHDATLLAGSGQEAGCAAGPECSAPLRRKWNIMPQMTTTSFHC